MLTIALSSGNYLQAEVERLPDHLRAVVVLCYWESLTHEQAAARLGCPLGTVRSRVARARNLLHRRLTDRRPKPFAGMMAAAFDLPAQLKAYPIEIPASLVNSTVQVANAGRRGRLAFAIDFALHCCTGSQCHKESVHDQSKNGCRVRADFERGCVRLIAGSNSRRREAARPARFDSRRHGDQIEAQPPLKTMGPYVVEPPDVLLVEVLDALPGRPIEGEHVVQPDGTISLNYYGELSVSGLTLGEIKTKLVRHLQTYLKDEKLGLIKVDPENGEPIVDRATGRVIAIEPKDAANVYVAVSASKSKHYYVQGAVAVPGRVPVTGMETVLDAIQVAGGLAPDADPNQVFLYRPDAGAAPAQQLKIDVDQITMGDDLSTNYQLLPGDRLVVRRQEDPFKADGPEPTASEAIAPETPVAVEHSGRRQMTDDSLPEESTKRLAETVQQIDKRLAEVERKLDVILRAVTSARR